MDYIITRNNEKPYLFNLRTVNGAVKISALTFEQVQRIMGEESIDYARIDDGRYMLLV